MTGLFFGNDARQTSRQFTDDADFPCDASVANDVDRTAFVGEIEATFGWRPTPGGRGRVGCSTFWLAGLQIAAE